MTKLSPAAQAVKDATLALYSEGYARDNAWRVERDSAVAVLRALADHQLTRQYPATGPLDHWDPDPRTRRELRNIADELEKHND
jgi:uncharacterized protein YjiS (DUF1127 family)